MNLEILNHGKMKGQDRLLLFATVSGPKEFSSPYRHLWQTLRTVYSHGRSPNVY